MFKDIQNRWIKEKKDFSSQVMDSVGKSICSELFDENANNIKMIQGQNEKSKNEKKIIVAKLAELRSIY